MRNIGLEMSRKEREGRRIPLVTAVAGFALAFTVSAQEKPKMNEMRLSINQWQRST